MSNKKPLVKLCKKLYYFSNTVFKRIKHSANKDFFFSIGIFNLRHIRPVDYSYKTGTTVYCLP